MAYHEAFHQDVSVRMMEDDVTMEVFCQVEARPPRAATESYSWLS